MPLRVSYRDCKGIISACKSSPKTLKILAWDVPEGKAYGVGCDRQQDQTTSRETWAFHFFLVVLCCDDHSWHRGHRNFLHEHPTPGKNKTQPHTAGIRWHFQETLPNLKGGQMEKNRGVVGKPEVAVRAQLQITVPLFKKCCPSWPADFSVWTAGFGLTLDILLVFAA